MNMYRHITNRGRAAVYARRSHWDEGVSLSVTTQAANCRRQAELMGFTVGDEDVFLDDGISGMTDDRPGFRAIMLTLFSPERPYKAVLVTDISRLSRSSTNYFEYEDIFATEAIELISLMDPPGNPEVKIDTNRRMKAVMNEGQVVDCALKTRASQMLAVETGFYIGWVAPFGYRKRKVMWKGEEHTKLERDPDTWPHLLHIIDMGKTNYTLSQIRQYLERTGLKHPAGGPGGGKLGLDYLFLGSERSYLDLKPLLGLDQFFLLQLHPGYLLIQPLQLQHRGLLALEGQPGHVLPARFQSLAGL